MRCNEGLAGETVLRHAHVHDLTILPMAPGNGYLRYIAETVIFGSGRPTLIVPTPKTAVPTDL